MIQTQLTLDDSLDPQNDDWRIWWEAREKAVCDNCFILHQYAIPHNASGKPFYIRKKRIKGSLNKLCFRCYWDKLEEVVF